jgi:PGF-pre-PGF domain-containing protein
MSFLFQSSERGIYLMGSETRVMFRIILATMLLVSVVSVSGQGEIDFSAGFGVDAWQKKSQPCDATSYSLSVTNLAEYNDRYIISVSSERDDFDLSWISISETDITLAAGENREISVVVQPACEAYGKVDVNLHFLSVATELEAAVLLETDIERNYGFTFEAGEYKDEIRGVGNKTEKVTVFKEETKYSICDNKRSSIALKLKNEVEIGNVYRMQVNGTDFVDLDHNGVALYGDGEAFLNLILEPELGSEGEYKIIVEARAERGDIKQVKELDISVRDCFGLKLEGLQDAEQCNSNAAAYNFNLINEGEFKEDVVVSVKGKCASLSVENVTIAAKGSKNLSVEIDEECSYVGDNKIIVKAVSLNNSAIKMESSAVVKFTDVQECYKTSIEDGKRIVSHKDKNIVVKINNEGTKTVNYETEVSVKKKVLPLTKTREDFASISEKQFSLNVGEHKELNVALDLENVASGRYDVKVKAAANDKVKFSRNILVVVGPDNFVNFVWYYKYYALIVLVVIFTLIVWLVWAIREAFRTYETVKYSNLSAGKEIRVQVKEELSVRDLRAKTKQELGKFRITIEKKKNKTKQKPAEIIYETFEVACTNLLPANLADITLKYRVSKKWIENNKLNLDEVGLRSFDGRKWKEYSTKRLNSDKDYIYYKAEVKELMFFAVTETDEHHKRVAREQKEKEAEEKRKQKEEEKKIREDRKTKLVTTKKESAKRPERGESKFFTNIIKFCAVMILLLLIVLGVLNGYIYYIVGGVVGAGLIISVIKLTEYYKGDEHKNKKEAEQRRNELKAKKEEERRKKEEEKQKAKEETERKKKEEQERKEKERREIKEAKEKQRLVRVAEIAAKKREKIKNYSLGVFAVLVLFLILAGFLYYYVAPTLQQELGKTAELFNETKVDKLQEEQKQLKQQVLAEQERENVEKFNSKKTEEQREFLEGVLEESVKDAIVKSEDEKLFKVNLGAYFRSPLLFAAVYVDYIVLGVVLIFILFVVANISKGFRKESSDKGNKKEVTSKKNSKFLDRLGKKIVDFFFEEE